MYAFAVAFLTAFLGISTVYASDYPTLNELCGRYVFNGTMTSMAEEQGGSALEPVARTGYTMVVVPGEEANTVKVLGFCGYGGGLTATYDETTGKLHCEQNAFHLCTSFSYSTGEGMYAVVDAGVVPGTYEPLYLDLNFQVSEQDGKVVITSAEDLNINVQFKSDEWTYAAGYTLTKEDVNFTAAEIAGVYEFKGNEAIETSVDEAFEEFDMTLTLKENGKVGVKGLFDFADEIEADYIADGGILLLPSDFVFSNGTYMGSNMDEGVIRYEAAPYFLVGNGTLTTPSTFAVYGEFDADQFFLPSFSFCGGTATKKTGDGVENAVAAGNLNVTPMAGGIRVDAPESVTICVYDACGAKVAGAVASSVEFGGLQAGVYIVKAGEYTTKTVVK